MVVAITPMTSVSTQLKHQFQLWLQSQKYQPNTVKNYLADINRYFSFLDTQTPLDTNPFSQTAISAYISFVSTDSNHRRYLASLNKLCQFALDQHLITSNPIKKILKSTQILSDVANLDQLVQQYSLSLQSHKTPTTIKNYLNDLRQFISWSESHL